MALVRGAEAAVQSLLNEGATTLFGIPGVTSLELYDAFVDHPELRHVETRHEQGAIFMADGYARASGEPGVACTSGGPGALNTLTAMGTAYNDGVPVLHLVSENERTLRGKARGFFHDVNDQLGVFRSVIDYAAQVLLPEEIPSAIHGAAYALRNRRPRPALVELPGDVLKARAEMTYPEWAARVERAPAEAQVRAAAELLAGAKAPVIWAGSGVGWAGASELLRQVAERLGAPVLTSQLGKGAIPADHPLHVGNWASERPVQELLARSDALLAVGTRFTYFPTRGWSLRLPSKLVHVDLDAAEIGRNYPASVGVVGHARPALAGLLAELERLGAGGDSRAAEVQSAREAIIERIGPRDELAVLEQIRSVLPRSGIVCNDPTTIVFWARAAWPVYEPRTWFVPAGFGTLGYALPAAIGAKLAQPERAVVAMMGDAGVMFTIQDFMTAVQENVPIVLMIFNDEGYGVERRHQDHLYGRRSGVDVRPPDFVRLAEAFGAAAFRVADLREVGAALQQALATNRPALVEVPNRFAHPGYGSFGKWD